MNKPIPIATVDKKGRVICPTCKFKIPVPDTHSLSRGTGKCPMNHDFFVDDTAVEAFHHFLGKQGSRQSKEILKNHEEMPKELKETLTEGGIVLPPGVERRP